ncbi:G patch domain-containing protein 11 [Galendromus occidentalis]|uniref:G patch domain-containing protein 11 n=1 Tax=Galendromus occidentalis TaxID=34638 RepID=A0AAJ7L522_9ACAR|nr:G patch domain-containing protein 11 [Galendromus occidentalis]
MASEDEEDDYMSDKILQKIEDVRPGVPMKKNQEREFQVSKRKAELNRLNRFKKRHVLEEEQRKEGLSKPIDESNKGFALLSKMGFKPGMSLGTQSTSSPEPALVAPIEVKMKTDGRGGLGMAAKKEESAKERLQKHLEEASKRDCSKMAKNFRKDKQSQYDDRALRGDVQKSQRACRQLELELGLTRPKKKHFWPPQPEEDDDQESSDVNDDDSPNDDEPADESEVLRDLTHHLRFQYFYCIWCGCKYEDSDDLEKSCPGDCREAHDE